MNNNNIVLVKSAEVEGIRVEYKVLQTKRIFEGETHTFYDISVEKASHNALERRVCHSVTTILEVATKLCDLMYENKVLPENLEESLEECLELVI
jgi:23S rRNA maturation-related 3'-5' exoribonuclease YhaM